nr:acyl carrier protein [uncultured Dyadobacter sp.]
MDINIREPLYMMLSECCGLQPAAITEKAHLIYDLGLDSLDIADLTLKLEVHFGIQISDIDQDQLMTVAGLEKYVLDSMSAVSTH